MRLKGACGTAHSRRNTKRQTLTQYGAQGAQLARARQGPWERLEKEDDEHQRGVGGMRAQEIPPVGGERRTSQGDRHEGHEEAAGRRGEALPVVQCEREARSRDEGRERHERENRREERQEPTQKRRARGGVPPCGAPGRKLAGADHRAARLPHVTGFSVAADRPRIYRPPHGDETADDPPA
jgi:hypothetical protein